jgi:hypothetical protein
VKNDFRDQNRKALRYVATWNLSTISGSEDGAFDLISVLFLFVVSWFDDTMSMNIHVGKVCSKAFHGLYNDTADQEIPI